MKINILEIENSKDKQKNINFSEIYEEFNKEIPVTAQLNVSVTGNLIKIKGIIEAKLNLICDLCLKEFTKEIQINIEEYYIKDSLNEACVKDFEISEDGFIEDLNGADFIDITNFVYQCVILHIPNKLVCDINCNGDENLDKYLKKEESDPRLEIFKNIKIEKE